MCETCARPVKSPPATADVLAMAAAEWSSGAWLAVSAVIVSAILTILRFICNKIQYEIQLHQLTIDARRLRESYVERIKAEEVELVESRSPRRRAPKSPPPVTPPTSIPVTAQASAEPTAQAA